MIDPLSQVIQLLRPSAVFSKGICGAGRWAVRYGEFGQAGFCAVTEGRCHLAVDGEAPVVLEAGDFVLLPATPAFTMSGFEPAPLRHIDPQASLSPGREIRYGRQDGPVDVRQFGGWFKFGSPDAALLVSRLPRMIHVRGVPRLAQLVRLVGEEAACDNIGRDFILERLVEILLIEALRAAPGHEAGPGLLRGLADARIAKALRCMHGDMERSWTIPDLAREAGMSRSAFFDRFTRMTGVRPMEYLLSWRMAVAKSLLRGGDIALDEVAGRIGYGSASTFSTAFSRHVGIAPGRFMRMALAEVDTARARPMAG
ncbi:AraC family transcriptional regulator [Mesorhizobium microcysteis]|uniref:AraC family transcriptional regulator n=1 Tax=Neoaquamicrobium microcysteis TaxID=2682781 RepID=A0A5D4GND6_9HYPH|nr:AraC family transcriptional regulator [Mesorhizobium microcysteis]TYR29838.1 AraC family transcriptional regulator [Mesorhizobium microcysteis]